MDESVTYLILYQERLTIKFKVVRIAEDRGEKYLKFFYKYLSEFREILSSFTNFSEPIFV
jgi:hypothetical protein